MVTTNSKNGFVVSYKRSDHLLKALELVITGKRDSKFEEEQEDNWD